MGENDTPQTPTIVEDDGWTLASGSQSRPSENDLRQALGAEPVPAGEPAEPTEPAEVTEPEPAQEEVTEPDAPAEVEAAAPAPAAKKKRAAHDPQKRIDRMSADLASERSKTIALERELQTLRSTQQRPPAAAAPAPAAPAAAEPTVGPKPVWGGENGFEQQGKTWEEYETASQQWTQDMLRGEIKKELETRLTEERRRAETTQMQSAADNAYLARVEALRAKRPDYDQVIEQLGTIDSLALRHIIYYSPEGPSIGLHLAEHVEQAETLARMQFTPPVVDAVLRSAAPVKVLEHLALNPMEMEMLRRLPPVAAGVAIGRLEARLNVAPSVTTGAAKSVTSARPPLRTVGGGAPMTRAPQSAPANDVPFGPDYIRRENQVEAQRRERTRGY